jgi:hypothetical protein
MPSCTTSVASATVAGLNYAVGNITGTMACLTLNGFGLTFNGTLEVASISDYLVSESLLGLNDIIRTI